MARIGWGRHSTVATGTDSGDQVSVNAWNANLATSGILGFTKQSASISSNNITPTDSLIEVQATGTLNTLTPTDNNEFDLIYLIAASGATVTITHDGTGGAGKIRLLSAINKTLSTTVPTILMCRTISGNKEWVEYGGGAINSIDDINDVVITSATPSQVLTYDGTNWINQFPTIVGQFVRNSSGSPIAKGKAVYVSGYDVGTGYPEISLADNSSSSTMSALGITNESIGNNATGFVIINGKLSDIDTSTFLVNATVYVGTSGSLTTTKPTGTALIQNVGKVLRSHSSNGQIEVISIGRTNDIPNIAQDNVWVGNASGVPTATATTGSGNVVRATSATLTTPTIGAATATSINKVAITAPTTSATLTIADGKTLTANNSITLAGTDATTITLPSTSGTVPLNNQTMYVGTTALAINRASASQSLTGITSIDGSAATLTTARTIYGNSFNGSADLTQIIASTFGGTGNGFTKFSGATTAEKTYTLPNATCNILTDNTAVTVAQGGTGQTSYTNGQLLIGNTTGNTLTKATLTAGSGISITNGGGSITIAASGGAAGAELNSLIQASTYSASNASPVEGGAASIWIATIDSNNQGVYARIKKNGSYVNVQIA